MTNVLAIFFAMLIANGVSVNDYVAKPGDSLVVTVLEQQSLSGNVTVDSNGNVTLPMPIGSFYVAGLTAKQISDMISGKVKDYLVNSTVYVYIIPAEGFTVHVLGEVQRPGFMKVPDGTTIQEAVGMMGGFTPLADKKHIVLIRKNEESGMPRGSEAAEQIFNLELFIEKTDRSANPPLKSGDVMIVPRLPESERIKYINVIGAVMKPGPFETEKPLPLIDAITLAGGLSSNAVPEEIAVLSVSGDGSYKWKRVNFTSFLKENDLSGNPMIELGNTVFVPAEPKEEKPSSVNVIGQVIKPGTYSVTEESRLIDAIYMAGGFLEDESAIDKVRIIHISSGIPVEVVDVKQYLVSGNKDSNPLLTKGDTIFVPMAEGAKKISSIHSAFFPTIRVSIIGEVAKPDIYQVSASVNILDILKLAGGHTSQADLEKVTLIREIDGPNNKQQQKIDLKKVLTEGEFSLLPKLSDGDTIFIPRKSDRAIWGTIVKTASDISTIAIAFLILTGRRY
ncbi:MAG: SLBB domain-containing protein [Candidatus Poribacteria bacterium]